MGLTKNVTAIVTKAEDYGENDRLVRLFTVEGGMVRAIVRGVKKQGAKLKFCAQPFAFCRYEIATKGDFNTVAGAAQIESLFGVTREPVRYAVGCLVLEASDVVTYEIPNPSLFVKLLKTLKTLICDENINPYLVGAKYITAALAASGYGNTYTGGGRIQNILYSVNNSTLDRVSEISATPPESVLALKTVAREIEIHFDKSLLSLLAVV